MDLRRAWFTRWIGRLLPEEFCAVSLYVGWCQRTLHVRCKKKQVLPSCGKGASGIDCTVAWEGRGNSSVPFIDVPVACGTVKDTLRVLSSEKTVTVHIFADVTFQEVYFQQGRTAMTVNNIMSKDDDYMLTSTTEMTVQEVEVWPIGSPWIDEEAVRKAPRVYK